MIFIFRSYGGYGGGSEYGGFPNSAGGAQQQPPQPPQMSTQVSLLCYKVSYNVTIRHMLSCLGFPIGYRFIEKFDTCYSMPMSLFTQSPFSGIPLTIH